MIITEKRSGPTRMDMMKMQQQVVVVVMRRDGKSMYLLELGYGKVSGRHGVYDWYYIPIVIISILSQHHSSYITTTMYQSCLAVSQHVVQAHPQGYDEPVLAVEDLSGTAYF